MPPDRRAPASPRRDEQPWSASGKLGLVATQRQFWIALALIVALAFGIRAVAADHYRALEPKTDAVDYDRHAVSIAAGDGFPEASPITGGPGPSAWRPPLYPYFLGGVYALSGTSDPEQRWFYGRIAQALLGAIAVGLLALIALQLFGRLEALLAGLIAAVYPPLIFAGTTLLTEPLFIVLMLAGIAAVLRYRSTDPRLRWLALAGLCAGLATLDRSNGIVLIAVLALGAWTLRPRLTRQAMVAPAVVVLTAALAIAPWTIRNAIELDSFVPVTTQLGFGLAGQYNDIASEDHATWVAPFRVPEYESLFQADPPLGEVELADRLSNRAKEYVLDHPGQPIVAAFWNSLRFFNLDDPVERERQYALFTGQPQGLAELSVYSFWLLALLAGLGLAVKATRHIPRFIWLFPPLLLVSVMFLEGYTRYRTPLDTILILAAAGGLVWIARRVHERVSARSNA